MLDWYENCNGNFVYGISEGNVTTVFKKMMGGAESTMVDFLLEAMTNPKKLKNLWKGGLLMVIVALKLRHVITYGSQPKKEVFIKIQQLNKLKRVNVT